MAKFIDPTDEGNNNGDNNTGIDTDIDTSLGLGAAANAENGEAPTIGEQEEYDQSIYDRYGDFTYPFSTVNRYIQRRHIAFHCIFYTQRDEYDAAWVVGKKDGVKGSKTQKKNEFDQELMGFHTDNQNKGIPTMEIYLFAYRDWEQILRPNDYVALRVFESYPDDPYYLQHTGDTSVYPEDRNGVRHRTLMVGLISNIQISESTQAGRVYVITCSGMQKILSNVNLGMSKIGQWNDVNLIYDINGASNPANETFPTDGSSKSSSKSSGGGAYGLSGAAGEIAKCLSSSPFNCSKAQIAGAIGNAAQESGGKSWKSINPKEQGGGVWQNNSDSSASSKSVSSQTKELIGSGGKAHSGFEQFKSDTSSSSPSKCADAWCEKIEIPDGGDAELSTRESQAESVYHAMH